jgi:hypothetical protein
MLRRHTRDRATPASQKGIVRATATALLAYFGGKVLADEVSRYVHYAGAAIVTAALLILAGPRLIHRIRFQPPTRLAGKPL